MPRLFVGYSPERGAELTLVLRARTEVGDWGPQVRVEAIVDSGATSSYLRTSDADALGVPAAQRVAGPILTLAGGQELPSERLLEPVYARVIHPETGTMWGPTFQLQPNLAEAGDRLLGVRDFFAVFEVAFWPDPQHPRFSLVV